MKCYLLKLLRLINFYVEQGSYSIFIFNFDIRLFTLFNSNVSVLLS